MDSYELTLDYSVPWDCTLVVPATDPQYTKILPGAQSFTSNYPLMNVLSGISSSFDRKRYSEVHQLLLISEDVLRRDWDSPEEDEAWADL
ncbi:MAG: hypothetical protein NTW97_00985 [Candidatus Krumholzibacteria bacterium]|nr:hypothetical protein [Candidatus Krumholzibacteria bacterium]